MRQISEYLAWEDVLTNLTAENFNDSLVKIIELLKEKMILELSFNGKDFSDLICRFLAELINKTPNLTSLSVDQCSLTNVGFATLISAIERHQCITKLYLDDLNLYVHHPGQDLHNPFLCHDRGYSSLGDREAIIVAKLLKVNNSLQNISLTGNHITDEGARLILDALLNQTKLWELKFSGGDISADIKGAIKKILKRNREALIAAKKQENSPADLAVNSQVNNIERGSGSILNGDTISRIMFFCDLHVLSRSAQVCRAWREEANMTWRHRLSFEYPEIMLANTDKFDEKTSYLSVYIQQRRLTAAAMMPLFVENARGENLSVKELANLCVQLHVSASHANLLVIADNLESVAHIINQIEHCLFAGYDSKDHSLEGSRGRVTLFYFLTKLARFSAYNTDENIRDCREWLVLLRKVLFCIEFLLRTGVDMDFVNEKGHTVFRHIYAAKPILQKEMCKLFTLYYQKFDVDHYLQQCFKNHHWKERDIILFLNELGLSAQQCLDLIIRLDNPRLMKVFLASYQGQKLVKENALSPKSLIQALEVQKASQSPLRNIPLLLLLVSFPHIDIPMAVAAHSQVSDQMQTILGHYLLSVLDADPQDNVECALMQFVESGKGNLASALVKGGAKILSTPLNANMTMTEFALACGHIDVAKKLAIYSVCLLLDQPYNENPLRSLPADKLKILAGVLPTQFQFLIPACQLGVSEGSVLYADKLSEVAAYNLQESTWRKLLAGNYDVNQVCPGKFNLLQSACYHSNATLLKLLVGCSNVQMKTLGLTLKGLMPEGANLLFLVLAQDSLKKQTLEVVTMLIAAGVDPNETLTINNRHVSLLELAKAEHSQAQELIAYLEKCCHNEKVVTTLAM